MKETLSFFKTILLGGLVAIVPFSAVAFVLWSILRGLIGVIEAMGPIMEWGASTARLFSGSAQLGTDERE